MLSTPQIVSTPQMTTASIRLRVPGPEMPLNVAPGIIPASTVFRVVYTGPYEGLAETWMETECLLLRRFERS